ncbi:helix-turn-helix transcriptional regulator [Burkholderia multivorans]|uniref:helix-turn-helix transcriptional regulator n=1 Tax=Burkholderia multivorans TaxID=87883 RepID=UPI001E2C384B|nr:helix-turn-helix domain-containing protein [Burkholderia multivorans]MDI3302125.1 helix-turn-helix domain-containing protein [Burkholderia multivorans]
MTLSDTQAAGVSDLSQTQIAAVTGECFEGSQMTSIDKRCNGVSKDVVRLDRGGSVPLDQRTLNNLHIAGDCASSRFDLRLTTDQVAQVLGIETQTVRKRWSQTGSYFGLKPIKLPNRRLMWSAEAVAKFLRGEAI